MSATAIEISSRYFQDKPVGAFRRHMNARNAFASGRANKPFRCKLQIIRTLMITHFNIFVVSRTCICICKTKPSVIRAEPAEPISAGSQRYPQHATRAMQTTFTAMMEIFNWIAASKRSQFLDVAQNQDFAIDQGQRRNRCSKDPQIKRYRTGGSAFAEIVSGYDAAHP